MAGASCLLCRSRKIKCDRSEPECQNCARLGVTCPGYARGNGKLTPTELRLSAEAIYKASGREKRRVGSCDACRASKISCNKTRPSCRRCLARRLECRYSGAETSPVMSSTAPQSQIVPDSSTTGAKQDNILTFDDPALRLRLLTAYFDRVHPLRCLAFVHKPSFMYAFDRETLFQEYDESLVDAMCALGARHLSLDFADASSESFSATGQALSERAHTRVMGRLDKPTTQLSMTTVLLCEYASRTNRHAMAFVLVGCLFRQLCLLGIDTPANRVDSEGTAKHEIEHRLVWACYVLDAFVASGVDKNSSWRESYPTIPLPCSDSGFLSQTTSKPPSLIQALETPSVISGFDLPALSVTLIYLRTKVLRYIRSTHAQGNVWDPSSSFMSTLQQLTSFYDHLPAKYALTELNLYMLKDQHNLGAVIFLHLLYHAAVCDLTRITLPGFCFPLAASFQNAPAAFLTRCQSRCYFHAESISDVIRKGKVHGRMAFEDPYVADATFESTKIQIVYSTTLSSDPELLKATAINITSNLDLLNAFNLGESGLSYHVRALLPLCFAFGFGDIARQWQSLEAHHEQVPPEVVGPAEIHHLSSMAPFRRARTETQARQLSASSPTAPSEDRSSDHTLLDRRESRTDFASTSSLDGAHTVSLSTLGSVDYSGNTLSHNLEFTPESFMETSMPDYTKTAEEMSQYLTWDAVEWWNNAGQNQL